MAEKNPRILTDSGELSRPLNTTRLKTELRDYAIESSERFEAILMRDDHNRKRPIANSAYAKPVNIVKRTVYGVGTHLIRRKKLKTLERYLDKHSHSHDKSTGRLSSRMPPAEENPFFWMYLVTFFNDPDKTRQGWMLSRDEVSKHSRELYFAYKNEVPPEHLIGFIMQVGARNILTYYKDKDWFSWKELPRIG